MPDVPLASAGTTGQTPAILDKNWQTTAAVGLTVATAGVGGVVMLSVLPAQTLAMTGGIAALAYAGDRAHKGLPLVPTLKADDTKADSKPVTVKAEEPAPAAA